MMSPFTQVVVREILLNLDASSANTLQTVGVIVTSIKSRRVLETRVLVSSCSPACVVARAVSQSFCSVESNELIFQ